jgi:CubicO group peptidase (beta-lactamase class C family)
MKKRILRSLLITLIVILAALMLYANYIAHGITGYAAKNLASGIFVSGRTQESIEKEDISFFPVKFSKNKVDYEKKEVTSRFLIWKSTAIWNEGLGCTLIDGFSEEAVRKLDYPPLSNPNFNPDTIPWPAGDKLSDSIPKGIDIQKVNELLNQVFKDTLPFKGTFAITVVYKDQIVAEKYRSDIKQSTPLLSWSMAKSFTNAMTGLLVKDGKVDINKPLNLKEWANDGRKNITLNNLLHMNSGLYFNEKYSKVKLTDATTMLLKNGDMGKYAISKKLAVKPDSIWSYSSGTPNIIEEYLRSVIGNDQEYLSYPRKMLFNKTGMRSVIFEPDASGTFVGSSYLYATSRDYARFGLLYLHKGNWLGDQILSENWVNYTVEPAKGSNGDYGALFWLNKGGKFKGVPDDLFYCDGYDGQYIFIIPSKQLVVARNGYSPNDSFNEKEFLRLIVETIK